MRRKTLPITYKVTLPPKNEVDSPPPEEFFFPNSWKFRQIMVMVHSVLWYLHNSKSIAPPPASAMCWTLKFDRFCRIKPQSISSQVMFDIHIANLADTDMTSLYNGILVGSVSWAVHLKQCPLHSNGDCLTTPWASLSFRSTCVCVCLIASDVIFTQPIMRLKHKGLQILARCGVPVSGWQRGAGLSGILPPTPLKLTGLLYPNNKPPSMQMISMESTS